MKLRDLDPKLAILAALFTMFMIGMIAEAVSSGIDWIDRRHCRIAGGYVNEAGDSFSEWRCMRAKVKP